MTDTNTELRTAFHAALERLRGIVGPTESAAVAFSGGVDSSLLLKVAFDCLGERAVGVTAISESLPGGEREAAESIAREIGVRHVVIRTHEVFNSQYLANTPARCFHCKEEVYRRITDWAAQNGYAQVMDGFNLDDLADHRPGRDAGIQLGVRSPLIEAGLDKQAIREIAASLGLPVAGKPAMACLSSRIPHGTPITIEALSRIDRAESHLRRLGLTQVRVRHFDTVARIEVAPAEMSLLLAERESIIARFTDLGYQVVTLDLLGYRQGSLHAGPRLLERAHGQ